MSESLEIIKAYGWAAFVVVAVLFFLYRDLWPWTKDLVERAHKERIDDKLAVRAQMDKLTAVIDATAAAVRESTHVNAKLADRVEGIGSAVTDLRLDVSSRYGRPAKKKPASKG